MPRAMSRARAPGRDGLDLHAEVLAHPHDGALAELLLDLPHRHVEGFVSLHRSPFLSLLIGTGLTLRRGCDGHRRPGCASGKVTRL